MGVVVIHVVVIIGMVALVAVVVVAVPGISVDVDDVVVYDLWCCCCG